MQTSTTHFFLTRVFFNNPSKYVWSTNHPISSTHCPTSSWNPYSQWKHPHLHKSSSCHFCLQLVILLNCMFTTICYGLESWIQAVFSKNINWSRIAAELVLMFLDPVCVQQFSHFMNNSTVLLFLVWFLDSNLWLRSLKWIWLFPCMQWPECWFQVWGRRICLLVQWKLRCEASLV